MNRDVADAAIAALRSHTSVVLVSIVEPHDAVALGTHLAVTPAATVGNTLPEALQSALVAHAREVLARGVNDTRDFAIEGAEDRAEVTVFFEAMVAPPRLIIIGAVDFSRALVDVAKVLGFFVTICDARAIFATEARFPCADEVVVEWPDRYLGRVGATLGARDAICVLTHDAKFDVPAIIGALETDVGYIGAMGSRRTHEARLARLIEHGADEEVVRAKVMSPIGLDIGSRTPEETAISICAEIIAVRSGRANKAMLPLRDGTGPIH